MLNSPQNSWNDIEGQIIDNYDGTYVASFTPKDSYYGEYISLVSLLMTST